MVELLRHRQTKEAATDMFSLKPPRHIPTLPIAANLAGLAEVSCRRQSRHDVLAASITARDPSRKSATRYGALVEAKIGRVEITSL
jgi:hypothetical protein